MFSDLKSIQEKNGVISLNDGEFRFDFVMQNDDEYYFIYHLFERIVAFNKQNKIISESNYQSTKCDFINQRMNMSLEDALFPKYMIVYVLVVVIFVMIY